MGLGKDSLTGKEMLCMQAKKTKEFIHCFTRTVSCSAISRKAELHHAQQWLGKTNVPHILLPSFLCAQNDVKWYGMSLLLVGLSSPAIASPNSLCTPSLLASRAVWGTEKSLLSKHFSARNISMISTLILSQIQNTALYEVIWGILTPFQPKPIEIF